MEGREPSGRAAQLREERIGAEPDAGGDRHHRHEEPQAERRNRIEDEDRARRIDEEERRKKVYGDAADMMRGKAQERAALVQEAEKLRSEIAELKARIGG